MFKDTRRTRLRNRILCGMLGFCVLSFGIWLNYQNSDKEEMSEEAVKKIEAEAIANANESNKDKKSTTEIEETGEENEVNEEETGTENEPEAYLVKEIDGVVKVFLCDSEGIKSLYLITSIPFDLLSEEDQKLFEDGVEIETEDDLGRFLENFDS